MRALSVIQSNMKMKMAAEVRWLRIFIAFAIISMINANQIHRKFEYKYSFKPPYLAQKDGTVPFWEYGGNAIASSENVRVTPSLKSQKGAIWTKQPTNFEWWEIELVFRVTGRGRIGADGLAFWYTATKGAYDGTVFGSSDLWNGLGIFFDSFDNDNKHNNPYIMGVLNDGTKVFDHTDDGTNQLAAGCLRDFRNKPFPTRARIEYYKNTLTLLFHNGMTQSDRDYEVCFRVENVFLPKSGYFGVSAATGGLADDHDVLRFLTSSLYSPGEIFVENANTAEQERIAQEYKTLQTKLDKEKEVFHREHPDEKRDEEDWFETADDRSLRQVFTSQMHIFDAIRDLGQKLDEIVGKQERVLSLVSHYSTSGVQMGIGQQTGQPVQLIDTIRRQEVDILLNNHNIILQTAQEIKTFVGGINSKAETILQNQARAPTAQVQPMGYDYQSLISEMRDAIQIVKRDTAQIYAKLPGVGPTATCLTTNCLTTTVFIIFLVIQMLILIGYNLYRDNKEAQAKKFY